MNNSLQLLDNLLKVLQNVTEDNAVDLAHIKCQYPIFNDISNRDWETMRRKLVKDNMIDFIEKPMDSTNPNSNKFNAYFITFDGLLLLEFENGYEGRHITNQSEKDRIKSIENRQTNYSCWLVVLTALTVVVAAVSCWTNILTYQNQKHQKSQQNSYQDTSSCKNLPKKIELPEQKK